MTRRLANLLDLRPGEGRLTAILALQYFLLLLAFYFLKPARDALFLTGAGANLLPVAFVISALVAAPTAGFYSRLSGKLSAPMMTASTLVALALQLPLLRLLLNEPGPWVYYLLYAWVGVFGILTTSQFWLMAGEILDPAQTRRLFPLLGVAGIIGAFVGGELTRRATGSWGLRTEDLLLAGFGVTVCSAGLALMLWRFRFAPLNTSKHKWSGAAESESLLRNARLVFTSPLLRLIVLLIAVSILVTTITDYQFKAMATALVSSDRELASFLGSFYGITSLLSLLVQLLLSGRMLRWFGTVGALIVLPATLTLGTLGLLAAPGLVAATLLRGSDLTAKYSIQQTAREMLYLPVPAELKRRTKIVIDVLVDRVVRGAGGLLLLGLTLGLNVSVRGLSFLTAGLLIIWFATLFSLRREYVLAFGQALARRKIAPEDLKLGSADEAAVQALVAALSGGNERQIAYALESLPRLGAENLLPQIQDLLSHGAPSVRRRALTALVQLDAEDVLPAARSALDDANLEVRTAAITILMAEPREDPTTRLRQLLASGPRSRNATLIWLADNGTSDLLDQLDSQDIAAILADNSDYATEGRRALACALADSSLSDGRQTLEMLARDSKPTVARAAIRSLGSARDLKLLPWLLEQLGNRDLRSAVREALVGYGRDGLLALRECLGDDQRPLVARNHCARALGAIHAAESLEALLSALPRSRGTLRQEILRQAIRLRRLGLKLKDTKNLVRDELDAEAARWFGHFQVLQALENNDEGPPAQLLLRAITERQQAGVENSFALLGLLHEPGSIIDAGARLMGGDVRQGGQAIVFLEQVLAPHEGELVLPMVDGRPRDGIWSLGRKLFGLTIRDQGAALNYLVADHDDWVRASAVHYLRKLGTDDSAALLERAANDPVKMVREAAGVREGFR